MAEGSVKGTNRKMVQREKGFRFYRVWRWHGCFRALFRYRFKRIQDSKWRRQSVIYSGAGPERPCGS